MTVTIETPVLIESGVWFLEWSTDLGSGTTFYVYVDGVFQYETSLTSGTFMSPDTGSTILVEILDAASEPELISAWPTRATLAWYEVAATKEYAVEEYVGAVWTERQVIKDRGEGYFRWESRVLEDITTHQFRVTAHGTNGNAGTAATFSILIVRHPDRPDVAYTYADGTRKVTISAA